MKRLHCLLSVGLVQLGFLHTWPVHYEYVSRSVAYIKMKNAWYK